MLSSIYALEIHIFLGFGFLRVLASTYFTALLMSSSLMSTVDLIGLTALLAVTILSTFPTAEVIILQMKTSCQLCCRFFHLFLSI